MIVDLDSEPLLGLADCIKFDKIKRSFSVQYKINGDKILPKDKSGLTSEFFEIFDGLGFIPGYVNIKLKRMLYL